MDKVNNFSGHESHVPESLILRAVFWIPGDPARASPSEFFSGRRSLSMLYATSDNRYVFYVVEGMNFLSQEKTVL